MGCMEIVIFNIPNYRPYSIYSKGTIQRNSSLFTHPMCVGMISYDIYPYICIYLYVCIYIIYVYIYIMYVYMFIYIILI